MKNWLWGLFGALIIGLGLLVWFVMTQTTPIGPHIKDDDLPVVPAVKTGVPNDRISQFFERALGQQAFSWGQLVPISPGAFDVGETRKTVEQRLIKAGYSPTSLENFSWRTKFNLPSGAELYRLKFKNKDCQLQNSVMVRFDDGDRLIDAQGLQDELGCASQKN